MSFLNQCNTLFIPGPAGQLEIAIHPAETINHPIGAMMPSTKSASHFSEKVCVPTEAVSSLNSTHNLVGIVCHPHPLYGGTMHNKVVTTTVKALTQLGIIAIRFNYRGIGGSEGHYGEGTGEVEDLKAVLEFAKKEFPDARFILAGFSFGSHVSARVAHFASAMALISIAPPVNHFDFSKITKPRCPWLVIHGEKDELVPLTEVQLWLKKNPHIRFECVDEASHFFHGKLIVLRETICHWLSSAIPELHHANP